ncbi:hypothetical protein Tco_0277571 [Tanacetum coccineum]
MGGGSGSVRGDGVGVARMVMVMVRGDDGVTKGWRCGVDDVDDEDGGDEGGSVMECGGGVMGRFEGVRWLARKLDTMAADIVKVAPEK